MSVKHIEIQPNPWQLKLNSIVPTTGKRSDQG